MQVIASNTKGAARRTALHLLAWLPLCPAVATAQDSSTAFAVAREFAALATRPYWPGFQPATIPLAVFDGRRTYLFHHPSPPGDFRPLEGTRVHVIDGRHSAVTANSSAEIGGTATATLLADRGALPARGLAAVALHEAFHVFQRARHPSWSGNEGDVFLYPVDDARLLALRRLETEALRRALAAPDSGMSACWTRAALGHRRERFAGMDSVFGRYERLTELNEGLATYVQLLPGDRPVVAFPTGEFAATEVRARIYVVGPALALLLDRFAPDWKTSLERDDSRALDLLLADALDGKAAAEPACGFSDADRALIERTARRDAESVVAARGTRRRLFEGRPGWRVVVRTSPERPLWPQGFDPLNVERVDGGLLHTRFLRLGNDAGEVGVIDEGGADIEALTVGAGAHPLFNGVREVIIAGLARPEATTDAGTVRVKAAGLALRFSGATVREEAKLLIIELPGAAAPERR